MIDLEKIKNSLEYSLISKFYEGKKAERSGVPYMQHIDAGLDIMQIHGSSELAARAFCVHPLFQDNQPLLTNMFESDKSILDLNPCVIVLAMEYRRAANAYLCKPHTDEWTYLDLRDHVGWLMPDVAEMLIADKMQNREDFDTHHLGKHERSAQLSDYFETWLLYLTVKGDDGKFLWQQF